MFYVYLLKSLRDGEYYIGQTEALELRLGRHNNGYVPATKGRRPFVMLGYETFQSREEARFREYSLKKSANERKKLYRRFDRL